MALGLNRHITNLATMNTYEYLCRSHEMTSIAILIGLAAAKRGIFPLLSYIYTYYLLILLFIRYYGYRNNTNVMYLY